MRTLPPRPLLEHQHHGPLPFYCVREEKLAILSLATFGLYQVYWFYENWALAKAQYRPGLHPLWRAILSPFYCFSLAASVECAARSARVRERGNPVLFALGYLGICSLGFLHGPLGLLALFSFIPLIPIQRQIRRVHEALRPDLDSTVGWGMASYGALVLGFVPFTAVAVSLFVLPSAIVREPEIPSSDRYALVEAGVLEWDERLLYLYTTGVFSVLEGGSLLTDRRAVSYSSTHGDLRVAAAAYREVEDIHVRHSGTLLKPTVITLTSIGGKRVRLEVSRMEGLDTEFVAQLRLHLLVSLDP